MTRPYPTGSAQPGALAGIRVLDLTTIVMGPFATQILAQLGADVIKIEGPRGDDMRRVGPSRSRMMGPIFLQANQGKRSVVLDLKTDAGRSALFSIARSCDVFISNMRPKALDRLGLTEEALRQVRQDLIIVSCTGYDPSGPYADRPAYDDLIQGEAGIASLVGEYSQDDPSYVPLTIADRIGGLNAVYAVTAALFARERTGRAGTIFVPMFEAVSQIVLGDHLGGQIFDPGVGRAEYSRLLAPFRRPYRTLDGYLCVLVYNDKHWVRFFEAVGMADKVTSDPGYADHGSRAENIKAIYAELSTLMAKRTTSDWRSLLTQADIPNSPVNNVQNLLNDPHLRETEFITWTDHPTEGRVRSTRSPVRWQGDEGPAVQPAPALGQHTREVLEAAGCTRQEISSLLQQSQK